MRFGREVRGVERVNLLEEPDGDAPVVEGRVVRLPARPFEVATLNIGFAARVT